MPFRRHIAGLVVIVVALVGPWGALPVTAKSFPQEAGINGAAPPIGTWTGNFSSRNFSSFPATITITQDAKGILRGAAVLRSECISNGRLVIRLSGTGISLVGSDSEGDNVTFKGTIDSSGTQMILSYVINGSASGRCETDQGSGTVSKH